MIDPGRKVKIDTMISLRKPFKEAMKSLTEGDAKVTDEERVFLLNGYWENAVKDQFSNEWIVNQEIFDYYWYGKFWVYCDVQGQTIYLKLNADKREVTLVSLRVMAQEAMKIFGGSCFDCPERYMIERVERWGLESKNRLEEMPSSFALKGSSGLTFNRIDIDVVKQSTPMFDQICNRIESNKDEMMAFFWSIFERESAVDQYLWMTGDGEDGKGSLMRLLEKLLGDAYVGLSARNARWSADCVGKRLGVFNDIVKTTFPMTSEVKQVTGGDRVTIERKYKDAVSIYLDTKFVFTTNKTLNISGQKADLRRCIYVKFGQNTDGRTERFEERLWEERAGILFKCREAYQALSKEGSIKCDYDLLKDEVEDFEVLYESLFENYFELSPDSGVLNHQVYDMVGEKLNFNNRRYGAFKEWMKRVHGIHEGKRTRSDGTRKKMLVGLKFKNGDEVFEAEVVGKRANFTVNKH